MLGLDTIVVPEMYTDWEVPQIYLANIVDIDDVDEDDVYKIARVVENNVFSFLFISYVERLAIS